MRTKTKAYLRLAIIQYEMSKPHFRNKRNLGLIAGILAMGLVAASIAGGQALSGAAQQNSTAITGRFRV